MVTNLLGEVLNINWNGSFDNYVISTDKEELCLRDLLYYYL